jgi:amino acid transporter
MFALIAVGLVDASTRGFAPTPVVGLEPIEGITVLLVLRAFSSGATAMTGIEAISNAVPAFRPPTSRNARAVLTLMIGLLVTVFAGLVVLMHLDGIVPSPAQTALSQLAHRSFGAGPLYTYVQVATALVLLLAANTAFNGFPRLLSFMARNGHAPRLFLRLGDRLAFSNGIIALAVAAAILFAVFAGRTGALIPLYAVGVFVAFTFSQAGMVVHWGRRRGEHWRRSMLLNTAGAALSAIVFSHRDGDQVHGRGMGRAPTGGAARPCHAAHPAPLRPCPSSPRPAPPGPRRAESPNRACTRPRHRHPARHPRS